MQNGIYGLILFLKFLKYSYAKKIEEKGRATVVKGDDVGIGTKKMETKSVLFFETLLSILNLALHWKKNITIKWLTLHIIT